MMKQSIRDRLESLVGRLDELNRILASGEATRDLDQFRRMTREHAEVGPVVALYKEWQQAEADLASAQELDAKRLRAALEQTFAFRKTHSLPGAVPAPVEAWRTPYEAMVREDQLRWTTLDDVTAAAKAFLDPVLAGGLDATWRPTDWRWG